MHMPLYDSVLQEDVLRTTYRLLRSLHSPLCVRTVPGTVRRHDVQKIESTLVGLEPTRDKPNRFLVDRLNHSATVSTWLQGTW